MAANFATILFANRTRLKYHVGRGSVQQFIAVDYAFAKNTWCVHMRRGGGRAGAGQAQ